MGIMYKASRRDRDLRSKHEKVERRMAVKIFIPVYYVTRKFPWSKWEVAYKDNFGKIKVLDGKYRDIDVAQARADDLNILVARQHGTTAVKGYED